MATDNDEVEAHLLRSRALADSIKPLLAGQGSEVQGAVLVELVALHLAGHPAAAREDLLGLLVDSVRTLTPVLEKELFGPSGHPGQTQ